MQQTPQDPNQQFSSNQPPQGHQGFAPDPAYAPTSTIGDDAQLDPQESIEEIVKKQEARNKAFSLVISVGLTLSLIHI